jgi:hypothetical protein
VVVVARNRVDNRRIVDTGEKQWRTKRCARKLSALRVKLRFVGGMSAIRTSHKKSDRLVNDHDDVQAKRVVELTVGVHGVP